MCRTSDKPGHDQLRSRRVNRKKPDDLRSHRWLGVV